MSTRAVCIPRIGGYTLAVTVGMRQGELFALQWENVNLEDGWLSVRHTLTEKGKLSTPKTAKSLRRIELPALAVTALWTHKRRMEAEGREGQGFVFCNTAGGLMSRPNVRRAFQAILTAAKLPAIRFHDLRHTAASLMLAEGINAKIVQEVLGHSKIETTLNLYCHVLPTMQREAMDKLNLRLTGQKPSVGTLRVHIRHKKHKRLQPVKVATFYSAMT